MHGIVSRILFYVQTIQLGPMDILGAPSDEVGSEGAQAAGPQCHNQKQSFWFAMLQNGGNIVFMLRTS